MAAAEWDLWSGKATGHFDLKHCYSEGLCNSQTEVVIAQKTTQQKQLALQF